MLFLDSTTNPIKTRQVNQGRARAILFNSYAVLGALVLSLAGTSLPGAHAAGGVQPLETPGSDPAAQQLLDTMGATYQGLNSFSETMTFKVEGARADQGGEIQTTVAYKKPNLFSAVMTGGNNSIRAISDGNHFFVSATADKNQYLKLDVPPEGAVVQAAALVGHINLGLLPFLMGNDDTMAQLHQSLASLRMNPPGDVDGTPVEMLSGSIQSSPGAPGKLFIAVGKDDHFLRRVTIKVGDITRIETHTAIKANGPLDNSTFSFTPPAGAAAVTSLESKMYDPHLVPGADPLPFTAQDTNGKPVNLSNYRGKVVLLDFWASWCKPCWPDIPHLIAVYKNYRRHGFDIIGISLDSADTDRQQMAQLVKKNDMSWPEICDGKAWDGDVPSLYKLQAIPFTVLIGRDGKIIAVNLHGAELEAAIKKAMG